jgi:ArsR family transcriptional regulator, virulence genes transcriptional regulator
MNQSMFEIQADFCRAMGNAVRLQIVHCLREGPLTVTEICQAARLPQGSASRQLAILRGAGVVTTERSGNAKVYRIKNPKIVEVCDLVRKILIEQFDQHSRSVDWPELTGSS